MAAQDLLMSSIPIQDFPPYNVQMDDMPIKEEKIEVKTETSDFADNECAMALLCLATASVPVPLKEEAEEEETWSADPEGYCILKRQLRLQMQQESIRVKKIRLDHNYAWSGQAELKTTYKGEGSLYERESFLSEMGYCPEAGKMTKRKSLKGKRSPKAKKDVYQPNDSKYNNFNLLLKCLTKDEDNKSEGECDDPSQQHRCVACSKVFSKKRYLTKHQLRKHPEPLVCPTCGDVITRTTLDQHAETCTIGDGDLADCQFCGIRMRRHILAKHLALEHCTTGEQDLSDSSTLSGSEHDRDDVAMATSPSRPLRKVAPPGDFNLVQRNTVSCQLCGQRVSRMQLTEHLASVHSVDQDKSSSCKHSMLQRFLNDDQKTEECESCVSRLNNNYRNANSSGNSDCRSSSSRDRSLSPKAPVFPDDYTLLVKKEIPFSAKLVNGESI